MTHKSGRSLLMTLAVIIFMMVTVILFSSANSYAIDSPSATGRIDAASGACLRKSATTSSECLTVLSDNAKVIIKKEIFKKSTSTAKKNRWYYVKRGSLKGYVRADLVDSIKYTAVAAKTTAKVNYRKGAGTKMKKCGTLKKGKAITVYLEAKPVKSACGSSTLWYKIKVNSKYYYVCSSSVDIVGSIFVNNTTTEEEETPTDTSTANDFSMMTDEEFNTYLIDQGFPKSYRSKLKKLHKAHPNWVFVACNTGLKWSSVLEKETKKGVSAIHKSLPKTYRSTASYAALTDVETEVSAASEAMGTELLSSEPSEAAVSEEEKAEETTEESASEVTEQDNIDAEQVDAAKADAALTDEAQNGSEQTVAVQNDSEQKDSVAEEVVTAAASKDIPYREQPDAAYPEIDSIAEGTEFLITGSVKTEEDKESSTETEADGETAAEEVQCCTAWYQVLLSTDDAEQIYVYIQQEDIEVEEAVPEIVMPEEETVNIDADLSEAIPETASQDNEAAAGTEAPETESEPEQTTDADTESAVSGQATDVDTENSVSEQNADNNGQDNADEEQQTEADNTVETVPANDSAAEPAAESAADDDTEAVSLESPDSQSTSQDALEAYSLIEPGWYNASSEAVAYYLDPRNFLNEDRVYMFEDLSYRSEYQTKSVVTKIIASTKLPKYGFSSSKFVKAGAKYNVSPVFLAARARQETGGGSIAISGYSYKGTVVYNPFNIGATSGSNPVMNGIKYAYKKGWTTQSKAVNGGAKFLASGYINNNQHTIYFQKFNVANGLSCAGTHQYMTNIQAPYSESYSVKKSYASYGITDEPLTFVIPVFKSMPSKTTLP